jgi:hypothetical protein
LCPNGPQGKEISQKQILKMYYPPSEAPPKEFFGISSFRGKLRQARSWKIFGIL